MALSKKIRFEVFKRDFFVCQYCGKKPPETILEVDHIIPVSQDGNDDINNLITSCFDCNRGKSNKSLDILPETLKDNLEKIKEKENQYLEYHKYLQKINRRINKEVLDIQEVFISYFPKDVFSQSFREFSVRRFLNLLDKELLKRAMHTACSKKRNSEDALRYFCGICWNWIKKPETKDGVYNGKEIY